MPTPEHPPTENPYINLCRQVNLACFEMNPALQRIYNEELPHAWTDKVRKVIESALRFSTPLEEIVLGKEAKPSSKKVDRILFTLTVHHTAQTSADALYRMVMNDLAKANNAEGEGYYTAAYRIMLASGRIANDLFQVSLKTHPQHRAGINERICRYHLAEITEDEDQIQKIIISITVSMRNSEKPATAEQIYNAIVGQLRYPTPAEKTDTA